MPKKIICIICGQRIDPSSHKFFQKETVLTCEGREINCEDLEPIALAPPSFSFTSLTE